jgi:hypothetical protein
MIPAILMQPALNLYKVFINIYQLIYVCIYFFYNFVLLNYYQ